MLFIDVAPKTQADVWMLTLAGRPLTTTTAGSQRTNIVRPPEAPPSQSSSLDDAVRKGDVRSLLQTAFSELNAEVSPDGRWVAYQSSESGINQVHVRPFPNVDSGQSQVSTDGGAKPVWARSGRELFYSGPNSLMAVTVQTTGSAFNAGTPTRLFDLAQYYGGQAGRTYDVSADGQRFLMIRSDSQTGQSAQAPPPSLVVVEHWTEELKARVGPK